MAYDDGDSLLDQFFDWYWSNTTDSDFAFAQRTVRSFMDTTATNIESAYDAAAHPLETMWDLAGALSRPVETTGAIASQIRGNLGAIADGDPEALGVALSVGGSIAIPGVVEVFSRARIFAVLESTDATALRIAGTNPNVNRGFPGAGRSQNCVNCVIATDATLAGRPAVALPSTGPQAIRVLETQYGRSFRLVAGQAEIESTLSALGPGTRAIVYGGRSGGQAGHVFNAVVGKWGAVRFLDGQTGGLGSFAGYTEFHLLITSP